MIKRSFCNILILLIISIFVFSACAGAQTDHQKGRLVGGPCKYKSYPGQATIISITGGQAGDADNVKRFEVKFTFTPQDKIEESYARVEGRTFHLYGNNWRYPDQDFLKLHNIHVGKVLDGSLQVIVSGTCTPVVFDFPSLLR